MAEDEFFPLPSDTPPAAWPAARMQAVGWSGDPMQYGALTYYASGWMDGEDRRWIGRESVFFGDYATLLNQEMKGKYFYYNSRGEHRNQERQIQTHMLNAFWKTLVGQYPLLFGRVEHARRRIRNAAALETGERADYRLRLQVRVDDLRPSLRARLRTRRSAWLNNLRLGLCRKRIRLESRVNMRAVGGRTYFFIDLFWRHRFFISDNREDGGIIMGLRLGN